MTATGTVVATARATRVAPAKAEAVAMAKTESKPPPLKLMDRSPWKVPVKAPRVAKALS